MIQVSEFVSNIQVYNGVTNSLNRSQSESKSKSMSEGDQKGHKYTCFARSALCIPIGNLYDLCALVVTEVTNSLNHSQSKSKSKSMSL